jgi:hypothetical protein
MVQPETLRALGDVGGKVWSAIGPLIGVLVGAWLGRSWDHKKWMNDNRKEECRELLTAMMKDADSCMEIRAQVRAAGTTNAATVQATWADSRKCMIVLQDRIFIAKRLREEKLFNRWHDATNEFLKDGDEHKFGDKLNQLKGVVIDIAING